VAIRIFSYADDFLNAVEEAGFVVVEEGAGCYTALDTSREDDYRVVGHFSTEPGPVNLTDGVLGETAEEYLAYEG